MLIGDSRRLKQVLYNLIKNALKFTKNGLIEVVADYDKLKNMLRVKVIDTGVGIAEDEIPILFNRFGKLHRTASMNS